jgi:hypothetical protein
MTEHWTVEQYRAYLEGKGAGPKGSKFRNRHVKYDGYTFDSQAECDHYIILKRLQEQGDISGLRVHPLYQITDEYVDNQGRLHKAKHYEADFEYIEEGVTVAVDVKGYKTELFKLKWDLSIKRYPELVFRMVNA